MSHVENIIQVSIMSAHKFVHGQVEIDELAVARKGLRYIVKVGIIFLVLL